MILDDIAAVLSSEVRAIRDAPWAFVAAVALIAFAAWKVLDWQYKVRIESLNDRLKLKEDVIAHLKENAALIESSAERVVVSQSGSFNGSHAVDNSLMLEPPPLERLAAKADNTIEYITGLYEGRTHIQGDRLAASYIGKPIQISGTVEIMTAIHFDITTVTINVITSSSKRVSAYLMFPNDRDRLEVISKGEVLTAVGEIKEIESDHLKLDDCRLI